ncbi:MAG: hypothetical protein MJZ88_01545 [Paludibacteraceae bacterium]|nr:hypothetical protein [Paludibacteraceae bacterium]
MSLFFKSPIWSIEKFEAYLHQTSENIRRYRQVEQSAELQQLRELEKIVTTKEFQDNKMYLLKRKYKKTEQYENLHRFEKASKSGAVHDYLQLKAIAELNEKQSAQLAKLEIKQAVQDYLRLKDVVADEKFKQENAFWANPKRWYTTPESKQDERYTELINNADIQFFLHADSEELARWESYVQQWADNVDTDLAASDWRPGFAYKTKAMKANHSFVHELQAYNGGQNTSRIGKVMTIQVKHQSKTQAAWDEKLGFVAKDFAYTSDVIQTADKMRMNGGLIRFKVRCVGSANHVICLKNEDKLPIITLFQSNGKKVQMGIKTDRVDNMVLIKKIKPQKWNYIHLAWTKQELIWFVNNYEVLRMPNSIGNMSLFLQAQSFVREQKKLTGIEGQIEIANMAVYTIDDKFNYLVKA